MGKRTEASVPMAENERSDKESDKKASPGDKKVPNDRNATNKSIGGDKNAVGGNKGPAGQNAPGEVAKESKRNVKELIEKMEDKSRKKDTDVEESRDDQLVLAQQPKTGMEFSFWSLDYYYHDKYQSTNILIRYLLEIVAISFLLLLIPSICLFITKEKPTFENIFGGDTGDDSLYMTLFKRSIFLDMVYIFNVGVFLIFEAFVPVASRTLKILGLYESSFCWNLIENLNNQSRIALGSLTFLFAWAMSSLIFKEFYMRKSLSLDDPANMLQILLLWLGVYFAMLFICKFVVGVSTFEIKRAGFKNAIYSLNHKSFIFKKLQIIAEMERRKENYKEAIEQFELGYDDGNRLKHGEGIFDDEETAKAVANNTFVMLKMKVLDWEKTRKFFPKESESVFKYLTDSLGTEEDKSNKRVRRKQYVALATDLYTARRDMERTLRAQDSVYEKLDRIFSIIITYLGLIFLLFLFGANYAVFMASFGTSLLTFSWVFADTIKALFNCFVFLLVIRPYSIGDKVLIDGNELYVYKVDLLITTFASPFNELVYMSNIKLYNADIYNVARSPPQSEAVEIGVGDGATYENMLKAEGAAKELVQKEQMFFKDCHFRKLVDGKAYFEITHTKNFQNTEQMRIKRRKAIELFKKALSHAQVSYRESFAFSGCVYPKT